MARQRTTKARSPSRQALLRERSPCATGAPGPGERGPAPCPAILAVGSKWVNQTVLHYCFFKSGHFAVPKAQADAVRQAFATWKAVGIGLDFTEVQQLSEAEVRIGYSVADGSSASAVGRGVLRVPLNQPTTVYGWSLTTQYGRGTALHELGHVLGMEHEHQNPFAGIKWHEQAVYDDLAQTTEQLGPGDHVPQHPGEAQLRNRSKAPRGTPTRSWSTSSSPA